MAHATLISVDISEIARLQQRVGRYRMPVAAVVAAFSIPGIGARHATEWFIAVLLCELWTQVCTRPAIKRLLTRREMIHYIVSGAVTMPVWATLGVMFWFNGTMEGSAIATACWVVQLLYTQRFVFQSYLAVLMGNSTMVATMVVVPIVHPVLTGANQVVFEIALLFSLGFAISASLAAYRRVRSLAEQNAVIERAAITDELTGLPNRARFTRALENAAATGTPAFAVYMDLDRFKLVNDTFGHQAGDMLLRQFAGRLLEISPPGAVVARLGGDEFAVLIDAAGTDMTMVETFCRAILHAVRAPFSVASGQAYVGVSIGVARTAGEDAASDDLMRRADIAMYTMKATGRAGYRLFTDDLEKEVRSRTEVEQALRQSLETFEGLSLAYQPKVDTGGELMGVEALLRWQVDGRAVSPGLFVPIAEETGLIRPLGDWILREAVAFAGRWPGLSVAVNLSPVQLRDTAFEARLLATVADARLDPGRLELEVTETALFEADGCALETLARLRAAGFKVALDDFGTGHSSLRHLHTLSIDRVKIDQSFVAGLGRRVESAAIILAVIQLAHAMGLQITSEGVETEAQRAFLVNAQSDELQGYLFAKPLSEGELAEWVGRDRIAFAA